MASGARSVLGAVLCAAVLSGAAARAQDLTGREWRVGVFQAPPYSMKGPDGQWRGVTVDLWKSLAEELHLRYRFEEMHADAILEAIAHGDLDVSVGPAAVTIGREQILDFTHSYMTTGIGAAIYRVSTTRRLLHAVRALVTSGAAHIFLFLGLLTGLFGAAVWLAERKRNPQFQGSPLQGMGDGFWWATITSSGVGYGDKVPRTLAGRVLAVIWIVLSIVLLTVFTATLTANLAVTQINEGQTVAALRRVRVGTLEGSTSAEFLRQQEIQPRVFPSLEAASAALERQEIDALVYDEATLRYVAERGPRDAIDLLPGTLRSQRLAFPVSDGSALRDPINRELRHLLAEPRWQEIRERYLGNRGEAAE